MEGQLGGQGGRSEGRGLYGGEIITLYISHALLHLDLPDACADERFLPNADRMCVRGWHRYARVL